MPEPLNASEHAILDALLEKDGATVKEVRERFLPSDFISVLSTSTSRTRASFIKAVSSLYRRELVKFPVHVGELPIKGKNRYIVPDDNARIELTDSGWDVVLGD